MFILNYLNEIKTSYILMIFLNNLILIKFNITILNNILIDFNLIKFDLHNFNIISNDFFNEILSHLIFIRHH